MTFYSRFISAMPALEHELRRLAAHHRSALVYVGIGGRVLLLDVDCVCAPKARRSPSIPWRRRSREPACGAASPACEACCGGLAGAAQPVSVSWWAGAEGGALRFLTLCSSLTASCRLSNGKAAQRHAAAHEVLHNRVMTLHSTLQSRCTSRGSCREDGLLGVQHQVAAHDGCMCGCMEPDLVAGN